MSQELHRQSRNSLAYGTTTAEVAVDSGNVAKVQVRLSAIELVDLHLVEQRGVATGLPVGTPVVAVFVAGDRSNGAVVGSTAPSTRPPLEGPHDAVLYGYGWTIHVRADGIHITAPDVFIKGKLHVDGDIIATGEVTARDGAGHVTLSGHRDDGNGNPPSAGT